MKFATLFGSNSHSFKFCLGVFLGLLYFKHMLIRDFVFKTKLIVVGIFLPRNICLLMIIISLRVDLTDRSAQTSTLILMGVVTLHTQGVVRLCFCFLFPLRNDFRLHDSQPQNVQ